LCHHRLCIPIRSNAQPQIVRHPAQRTSVATFPNQQRIAPMIAGVANGDTTGTGTCSAVTRHTAASPKLATAGTRRDSPLLARGFARAAGGSLGLVMMTSGATCLPWRGMRDKAWHYVNTWHYLNRSPSSALR
jgi:hypothetical protein